MMEQGKLDSLQVCRAIAALLVVLRHFTTNSKLFLGHELLNSFFVFGHAGVSFFFVLSGFIICYTHWNDVNGGYFKLKNYVMKRLIRILPSYWLVLVIVSLLYIFYGNVSLVGHPPITPLLFLKNIFLVSYDTWPIVAVAWTLQYEMFFYLFFATFILNAELGFLFLIVWVTSIFIFNFNLFICPSDFMKFALSLYSTQFLMGCLTAYIIKKWSDWISSPKIMLTIGISGFLLCGLQEDYYNYFSLMTDATIYALFSVLIILALAKMESVKVMRFPKLFIFLGAASYSIYLIHATLLSILFRVSQHLGLHQFPLLRFSLLTFFVLGTTLILACIYHKFYEVPVTNFIRAKVKGLRGGSTVVVTN